MGSFTYNASLVTLLIIFIILYFSIYDTTFVPKVLEFKKEQMIRY